MITDVPSITKFIPSGKTPLNNYSYISLIFACQAIIIGNFLLFMRSSLIRFFFVMFSIGGKLLQMSGLF